MKIPTYLLMLLVMASSALAAITVTLNNPEDGGWSTAANTTLNFTIVGNYSLYNATLIYTVSGSGNAQTANYTKLGVSNNTATLTAPLPSFPDNESGYVWNINATSGDEKAASSANRTIKVDTTTPSRPTIAYPSNASLSTDYVPRFEWNKVTEVSFNRYWIRVDDTTDFSSPRYEKNITGQTTNTSTPEEGSSGELAANTLYYINITAFDTANNTNASEIFTYRTFDTCHDLRSGWNICSIVRNTSIATAFYAANFSLEIPNLTYVAKYNTTNQFLIHTIGAAGNADMVFNTSSEPFARDAVVFLYVEQNVTWQGFNSSLRGRTTSFATAQTNRDFNITNQSNGWNIVPVLPRTGGEVAPPGRTFSNLSISFAANPQWNGSCYCNTTANISNSDAPFFSYINSTRDGGSKYVPFVNGWSINENTTVPYGGAVWVFLNQSTLSGAASR